jgi:hypothetical protein
LLFSGFFIDESVSYDGYPQNAEKVNGQEKLISHKKNQKITTNIEGYN